MSVWILKSNAPFDILHGKGRMFHQREDYSGDVDGYKEKNFTLLVQGKQMTLQLGGNRDFCTDTTSK